MARSFRGKVMILRPRHFRAIELLTGTDLTQYETAREVGIAPRTLTRWLRQETFRRELEKRRQVLPFHLDGLRVHTARRLLIDVLQRLEAGEEKLPIREITQLVRQVADDVDRMRDAEPEVAPPEMTPEEVDAAWAAVEGDSPDDEDEDDEPEPEDSKEDAGAEATGGRE